MKIELKKISFSEALSEETNAFTADLYINGKKVGYCKNQGHGGCTDYNSYEPENRKVIADAEAYFKSLPKVREEKYNFEYQPSLESKIDELLEDWLKAKDQKKFEKRMVDAILYGVPNGHSYTIIKYKRPLSEIAKTHLAVLQKKVMEIKVNECKGGVQILNTNLEALGIKV